MPMFNHRQLIRAGVQPMESKCRTHRSSLESMAVRGKLDEDSARWLCGRVNKGAIP